MTIGGEKGIKKTGCYRLPILFFGAIKTSRFILVWGGGLSAREVGKAPTKTPPSKFYQKSIYAVGGCFRGGGGSLR